MTMKFDAGSYNTEGMKPKLKVTMKCNSPNRLVYVMDRRFNQSPSKLFLWAPYQIDT